jgi:hypothetical protein
MTMENMKITLNTPKVGNYLGKMTVGHSLAGQDIFTIEAINRVLVAADEQGSIRPEVFMKYIWQEANKPAEKEWQAEPFDEATVKAWQACCEANHTVLGLAVLRQARAERVLNALTIRALKTKEACDEIHDIAKLFLSPELEIPTTMNAYWYHVEGLHVPYANEAGLEHVGKYLIGKGYTIQAVEEKLREKVFASPFLNVSQDIGDAVEMDRFLFMTKQFQLACIFLTGYKNGQFGLSWREEHESYNEIVFGAAL